MFSLAMRIFLLTGAPGIGKTTVVSKVVDTLKTRGVSVGGMISQEVRQDGARFGFEIIDLGTGKHGWLAHVNQKTGPKVGKYRVNIADLEGVGVEAIEVAMKNCAVVAVDEVGPMELFSSRFKEAVKGVLESRKVVLAVVHAKAHDLLITEAKQHSGAEIFVVTTANRNGLAELLTNKILSSLERREVR
jgi:nucleoside-triphosphatase